MTKLLIGKNNPMLPSDVLLGPAAEHVAASRVEVHGIASPVWKSGEFSNSLLASRLAVDKKTPKPAVRNALRCAPCTPLGEISPSSRSSSPLPSSG
jgi:hypothetical protein